MLQNSKQIFNVEENVILTFLPLKEVSWILIYFLYLIIYILFIYKNSSVEVRVI